MGYFIKGVYVDENVACGHHDCQCNKHENKVVTHDKGYFEKGRWVDNFVESVPDVWDVDLKPINVHKTSMDNYIIARNVMDKHIEELPKRVADARERFKDEIDNYQNSVWKFDDQAILRPWYSRIIQWIMSKICRF